MKLILLHGCAGSGKTTAIARVASILFKEKQLFKIILDKKGGYSVDYAYFQTHDLDVRSLSHSCISCGLSNFSDHLFELYQQQNNCYVFVEIEHYCKDLLTGVIQPIVDRFPGLPVYNFQFHDARSIFEELNRGSYLINRTNSVFESSTSGSSIKFILTKKDLLTTIQLDRLKYLVTQQYPKKEVLIQNNYLDTDILLWLDSMNREIVEPRERSSAVPQSSIKNEENYSLYEGVYEFIGPDANRAVRLFIQRVIRRVMRKDVVSEHIKFLVHTGNTVEKISLTGLDTSPQIPRFTNSQQRFKVLVNTRLKGDSINMERIIEYVIGKIDLFLNVSIQTIRKEADGPDFLCRVYNAGNYAKNYLS